MHIVHRKYMKDNESERTMIHNSNKLEKGYAPMANIH